MEWGATLETIWLMLLLIVLPWGGLVLHVWALFEILRSRFDGTSKPAWIAAVLLVPFAGPLLYICSGRSKRIRATTPEPSPAVLSEVSSSAPACGASPARWLKPAFLASLLVLIDEQGVIAALVGAYLLGFYLPQSFSMKFNAVRKERLIRFAVYLSAVLMVFGLRICNTALAKERAAAIIAAAESYRSAEGSYPDNLTQLVPRFLARIPSKAKMTLSDSGFRYISRAGRHSLSYVSFPPFGRRVYDFESASWRQTD